MEKVDEIDLEVEMLDRGQSACSRIAALSSLLMSCGDQDVPPAADLRELAQLIHTEARIAERSMDSLAKASRRAEAISLFLQNVEGLDTTTRSLAHIIFLK